MFIEVSESVEEFGNKLKIKNANARKLNHFYKNLEEKVLAKMMTKGCDRLCASKSLTEILFERRSSLKGQSWKAL